MDACSLASLRRRGLFFCYFPVRRHATTDNIIPINIIIFTRFLLVLKDRTGSFKELRRTKLMVIPDTWVGRFSILEFNQDVKEVAPEGIVGYRINRAAGSDILKRVVVLAFGS